MGPWPSPASLEEGARAQPLSPRGQRQELPMVKGLWTICRRNACAPKAGSSTGPAGGGAALWSVGPAGLSEAQLSLREGVGAGAPCSDPARAAEPSRLGTDGQSQGRGRSTGLSWPEPSGLRTSATWPHHLCMGTRDPEVGVSQVWFFRQRAQDGRADPLPRHPGPSRVGLQHI